jgi:hypothetical protein
VLSCLKTGEIIEEYPEDNPYPSCLVFNGSLDNPLHVVVAINKEQNRLFIITVYEPSLNEFEDDYKTRRNN